jgi:hypothetical protein
MEEIMSDFHKMTIEELQKALSNDQRGKDISSETAILHSKVTMCLSNEIAYLKQALCEQAKDLQASNERLSKANEALAKINLWLTAIIALSTLAGVVIAILK